MKMKGFVFVFIFLLISKITFSQSFFDGLTDHLNTNFSTSGVTKLNKQNVDMLKEVFNKVEKQTKTSMFTKDTLYIISYNNFEIPYSLSSMLVWNSIKSCHYRYSFETKREGGVINRHFVVETDAGDRVAHLNPQLKKWIETADTLDFNAYKITVYKKMKNKADSLIFDHLRYGNNSSDVYTDGFMFFTVAIRSGKKWKFISSGMYEADLL